MTRRLAIAIAIGLAALGFALGRWVVARTPAPPSDARDFARALVEPDWLERSRDMSRFLVGLGPQNLAAAQAALEPQLAWVTTDELRLFMLAWSRFDPPGALAWALALPRPFHRNASGAAIYAWAFRDPAAARGALARVEDGSLRDFLEDRMVAGWAHAGGGRELTEYLAALPEGPRRFALIGMLAWELSKRGPESVIEWAEDAPTAFPRFKQAVFLKASTTLASNDPADAAARLGPFLSRPYAAGTLRVLARSWANRDPRAALAWLVELQPDAERDAAIAQAFSVWLANAPKAAIAWLDDALPDPSLDPAIGLMVARLRPRSPARALDWSLRLHDPELRSQFVTRIGRTWYHAHTGPAEAWLARVELPEALREAIRAPLHAEDAELPRGDWSATGPDVPDEVELPEAP